MREVGLERVRLAHSPLEREDRMFELVGKGGMQM